MSKSPDAAASLGLALSLLGQAPIAGFPDSGQFLTNAQAQDRFQARLQSAAQEKAAKKQQKKEKRGALGAIAGGLTSFIPGVGPAIAPIATQLGGTLAGGTPDVQGVADSLQLSQQAVADRRDRRGVISGQSQPIRERQTPKQVNPEIDMELLGRLLGQSLTF